jgi:hypothetical protein
VSYTIKNGRVVRDKHEQSRVDRFCRAVKDQTIQISVAEAKELTSSSKGKGAVIHMMCAHEDWCRTMQTGNGADCTCTPVVTYHRHPTAADKH